MTLSVPSFLAAASSPAIPPRSLADVAAEALTPPPLGVSEVFAGGEQAAMPIRATVASAATPLRRAVRVFTSNLRRWRLGAHPSRLAPLGAWIALVSERNTSVVVLGGGPGGYEAALVAAHLGAAVTVVDRDGLGGAAVLTDCVPSKTLISTSHSLSRIEVAGGLGVRFDGEETGHEAAADLAAVNERILELAAAQSRDIEERLDTVGVRVCKGVGRLVSPARVSMDLVAGTTEELEADVVLVATGATPRVMDSALPDGERILT